MTMSHICPMSHLKKLKELTGKALGKACCESCCQRHSCTGTGKPARLFPNCSPWQKCPLKSPESAISETPAHSERQEVIQGEYWGFKMTSGIMKCPVICTAGFSWVCPYPQCVLLGGLEPDFRIVIKKAFCPTHSCTVTETL